MSISEYLLDFNYVSVVFRLVLATICGGVIGLERGKRRQAAGFRTYALVCMGAALASSTNIYIIQIFDGDSTRISAQIISGIGFLGAGTILITGNKQIKGLTTAAGLWASGAMGLAIGVGFYVPAIIACILIFLILTALNKIEKYFYQNSKVIDFFIEFEDIRNVSLFLQHLRDCFIKATNMEITKSKVTGETSVSILITIYLPKRQNHSDIISILSQWEGIKYIEEI